MIRHMHSPAVLLLLSAGLSGQEFTPRDKLLIIERFSCEHCDSSVIQGKPRCFVQSSRMRIRSLRFATGPGAKEVDLERISSREKLSSEAESPPFVNTILADTILADSCNQRRPGVSY